MRTADLAQEMNSVRRLRDSHGLDVCVAEGREITIGKMLYSGEVLWFVFCGVVIG